jgi:hypothetical protein
MVTKQEREIPGGGDASAVDAVGIGSQSSSRHPRSENVCLALATTIASLLVLELALRLALPTAVQSNLPHFGLSIEDDRQLQWLDRRHRGETPTGDGLRFDRPDALLGWSPIPDMRRRNLQPGSFDTLVSTNADGLRGSEPVARARIAGRTRIAVFGCSQTFGAEVNDGETYPAQLQSMLSNVEVLNFGVHGFGTDQMLLRYERDGVPFRPDLVILGFAYYHLERNVESFRFFAKPRFVSTRGGLALVGEPVPSPEEFALVAAHPEPFPIIDASVLARWSWSRVLRYRQERLYRSDSDAWIVTRALIKRFADEVRANGSRFVVLNLEENSPDLEPVLAILAKEDRFELVNAGPALREIANTHERLRVPNNPHWGPRGHRVLAEQIRDHFCRTELLSAAQCRPPKAP